jgi:hypothetical protein
MADLTIVVDVRDNQTMSSYRIPPSGKLTYINASKTDDLTISQKNEHPLPLCDSNASTSIPLPLVIQKDDSQTVRVCSNFTGGEFLYTAQIGTAAAEDPIVIIEKSKSMAIDPLTAAILGAAVGVTLTLLYVNLRQKQRPQQG